MRMASLIMTDDRSSFLSVAEIGWSCLCDASSFMELSTVGRDCFFSGRNFHEDFWNAFLDKNTFSKISLHFFLFPN